jgi:hypothetical protein
MIANMRISKNWPFQSSRWDFGIFPPVPAVKTAGYSHKSLRDFRSGRQKSSVPTKDHAQSRAFSTLETFGM